MRRKTPKKSSAKMRQRRGVRRPAPGRRAAELVIAALAHDIRTPLTGILALAELLAASDLDQREQRWALGVKSAAEHLAQLTTIVCDAVRADVAGLKLQKDVFSPRRLAEDIASSLIARAETVGLKTDIAIAKALPDAVMGDPVRLRAAVENLIDNAVKFTARGTVALAVTSTRAPRGRTRLQFAVTDSGIGLKPEEMRKLFRPFAQASEAVTRRYGGTGLGLSLVKRIARAMGGDLTVKSRPGRGSTFALTVTVEDGVDRRSKASGGKRHPLPAPVSRRVLCVEDNPYGRVLLNAVLRGLGHRAEFASSGEAAIEAIKREPYDLVLMDIVLSGISGIEATRRIRVLAQPRSRIPIIGLSGDSDSETKAREAGMNAYLTKPISPSALTTAIESVLTVR